MKNDKNKICFAVAQMNPTVGDYPANTAKILEWIREAECGGADLIVFPECALLPRAIRFGILRIKRRLTQDNVGLYLGFSWL